MDYFVDRLLEVHDRASTIDIVPREPYPRPRDLTEGDPVKRTQRRDHGALATSRVICPMKAAGFCASWTALLGSILLCLGCPSATLPARGDSPEAFVRTVQTRMKAGLEIL